MEETIMSGGSDPRWDGLRDRDDEQRDVQVHWIELGRGPASDRQSEDDTRDRDGDRRDRARDQDSREPGHDPRDVFLDGLELPRGLEREVVLDRDSRYEINGEESRTLAAAGAFRVVSERDLRDPRDVSSEARDHSLRHLKDAGLVKTVSLDGRERAVTLTPRGRRLLEAHRRNVGDVRPQAFRAGVSKPRELTHDASLYRAYLRAEERLHEQGGEIRRVVLEQDLKTEYQRFLQEHNRGRSDSDGRPHRDPHEVEAWARDHELPYFDESVHFPDFRIEYELDGRDGHEDIEVLTEHYRGAHASSRVQAGFSCCGGRSGGGGRPFDPRVADEFL
jgi:DNA-binding MarR family transcriptional regulator